jgi:multiple sugar transport system permease protein
VRSEVFRPELLPDPLAWINYSQVWQIAPVLRWFFNSVLVGALAAGSVVISSALVAFGFAYFRFRGRGVWFGLVVATMMLPGAVTMIPTFLIWDYLGWTNTQVPLWAHNLLGPRSTFMLRQFFLTIPRDLFEAARVDGANYLQVWWRIAMPLSKPALIVVALFEFKTSGPIEAAHVPERRRAVHASPRPQDAARSVRRPRDTGVGVGDGRERY